MESRSPLLAIPTSLILPTLGGKQLWADEHLHNGYRIQQNVLTEHYRLLDPRDLRLHSGTYDSCLEALEERQSDPAEHNSDHLVLCFHGIFRSKDAMTPIVKHLRSCGYAAHAINYPSTRKSITDHADQMDRLLNRLQGVRTVSFVTHSMGGLVARYLLSRDSAWRKNIQVNRLLMLAPPNQGARIAELLTQFNAFKFTAGPAAEEMTPECAGRIPVPSARFGIIAGIRGNPQGYNPVLDGDDDMTVELSSTYLEGAEAHASLVTTHTLILMNRQIIQAIPTYLETGVLP